MIARFAPSTGWAARARMRAAGIVLSVLAGVGAVPARGAAYAEGAVPDVLTQAWRFARMEDPAVQYVVWGTLLLGATCGLLGGFMVVRRMALVGDALSHAVLPGVAVGFLWNMTRDPVAIFVGATVAGLIGTSFVSAIRRTTRLKEDAALGLVLASFFALGLCLLSMIQRVPSAQSAGLSQFLFGQAAAIGPADLRVMTGVAVVVLVFVVGFFKELVAVSFDAAFARSQGIPAGAVHHVFMFLLAAAVVIALQAVGVVLVSALLVTPAATAYLLTRRLPRLLLYSTLLGAAAGLAGAFLSFVGTSLPTGPLIVIASSVGFGLAVLFGPREGWWIRLWRRRAGVGRTRRENTLKSMYHVVESDPLSRAAITLESLAERRRETVDEVRRLGDELQRHGLARRERDVLYFTPEGRRRAGEIVRNHRLWELYLTHSANFAPDHVHDHAENIEHVLGETVVRELERRLNHARWDPHGRMIPSSAELERPTVTGLGGGGS